MAKGPLFIGTFTGKIGNVVGYNLKLSNDKVVQATRVYQPNVANPKTELQAIQRMKVAPAVNFYRQLSRILDNAWQGQRYGNRSRQFFMSLAMKQVTGIPFIPKGDKGFYPGEYPVSQGSLISLAVTAISSNLLTTSLISGGVTGTWGEVSQGLVNKNFGVKNGDKLTFIFVGVNGLGDYVPAFSYVILDTSSTDAASDVIAASNLSFTGAVDANLQVGVLNAVDGIVAGAVILSRMDENSGTTWQRSTSYMFCTEAYKELLMGIVAYQSAVMSYMDSENISSDWYLNEGITGAPITVGGGGNSGSNISVVSVANLQVPSRFFVAIATMSDGTKRAYRSNSQPSYVVRLVNSTLYIFENSSGVRVEANETNLEAIQGVDSDVTGWIVTNAAAEPDGESPEP